MTVTRGGAGWWWEVRRTTGTPWPVLLYTGYARTRLGARFAAWRSVRRGER